MKTSILTFLVLLICVCGLKAQNTKSGIAVSLGAAANYYYGQSNHNFDQWDNDKLNFQANGMLGLTIMRDQNDHRTMLAGFGSYGINNRSTMSNILSDQGYVTTALDQSKSNSFYKLEGGLLIAEILRLSTGVGEQMFNEQSLLSEDGVNFQTTSLRYYSSTVGFNLNLPAVAITLDCNFNYGKDFNNTVIIPSAGLMFRF